MGVFFSAKQLITAIETRLKSIPESLIKRFNDDGWTCIVTNQRNLEREYRYNYRISGLTDYAKKQIIIYAEWDSIQYSLPHELGHFLDYSLGTITKSGKWVRVFNYDSQHIPADKTHYFTEPNLKEEFFADAFLLYCDDKTTPRGMEDSFKVIVKSLEALPYVKSNESSIIVQNMTRPWNY